MTYYRLLASLMTSGLNIYMLKRTQIAFSRNITCCFNHCNMQELSKEFEEASIRVKSKSSLTNDQLLKIYSLYKQGTVGDNNSDMPSNPFDFVGKAKYEAWDLLRGTSREEAMRSYIDFVNSL